MELAFILLCILIWYFLYKWNQGNKMYWDSREGFNHLRKIYYELKAENDELKKEIEGLEDQLKKK